MFANPFGDAVRTKAAEKSVYIREQGFSGAAMLGMEELESGGMVEKLNQLKKQFQIIESKKNGNKKKK